MLTHAAYPFTAKRDMQRVTIDYVIYLVFSLPLFQFVELPTQYVNTYHLGTCPLTATRFLLENKTGSKAIGIKRSKKATSFASFDATFCISNNIRYAKCSIETSK